MRELIYFECPECKEGFEKVVIPGEDFKTECPYCKTSLTGSYDVEDQYGAEPRAGWGLTVDREELKTKVNEIYFYKYANMSGHSDEQLIKIIQ